MSFFRRPARPTARRPAKYQPHVESLEARCLLSGDPVLRWNTIAIDAEKALSANTDPTQQNGPARAARAMAIVQLAVYDAVNDIDRSYTSYLTDVVAPSGTSMDAAVAQAAHDTLVVLYSQQKATFDQDLAADLAAIPDGPGKVAGIALGQLCAFDILVARANDGAQNAQTTYTPGTQPGDWRPDPLHPSQVAYVPGWGNVKPFAMSSGSEFLAPPPPALDSQAYADAYQQVKNLGELNSAVRTADQTQAGIFWGYDGQPGLGTPVRLYNQITQVIAVQEHNTEVQNARLFALVNMAMADAGIAAWQTKYVYNYWRPIQAIRENDPGTGPTGLGSGNPFLVGQGDPTWQPLGAQADNGSGTNFTPGFPSYDSGHATFGGALFTMLADFYGTDNVSFTIGSDEFNGITKDENGNVRPVVTRNFTSFSQAMEENAMSRIYLGVHYSFDATAGVTQGTQVGNLAFNTFLKSNPAPGLTPFERFVAQIYRDLLHREADVAGLQGWANALAQGVLNRVQVVLGIESSLEYRIDQVEALYQSLLKRAADPQGLAAAAGFLQAGGTIEQLEAAIMGSPEYLQVRGGGTTAGFLTAIFQDVMGRGPTAGEMQVELAMTATNAPRADIVAMLVNSLEGTVDRVESMYLTYLHHAADAAGLAGLVFGMELGLRDEVVLALVLGSQEFLAQT